MFNKIQIIGMIEKFMQKHGMAEFERIFGKFQMCEYDYYSPSCSGIRHALFGSEYTDQKISRYKNYNGFRRNPDSHEFTELKKAIRVGLEFDLGKRLEKLEASIKEL